MTEAIVGVSYGNLDALSLWEAEQCIERGCKQWSELKWLADKAQCNACDVLLLIPFDDDSKQWLFTYAGWVHELGCVNS